MINSIRTPLFSHSLPFVLNRIGSTPFRSHNSFELSNLIPKQREDLLGHFERKMREQPEVMLCYFVSGDTDYLLVIHVSDMNQ